MTRDERRAMAVTLLAQALALLTAADEEQSAAREPDASDAPDQWALLASCDDPITCSYSTERLVRVPTMGRVQWHCRVCNRIIQNDDFRPEVTDG